MSARTLLHASGFDVAHLRLLARTPSRVYRARTSDGRAFVLRCRNGDDARPIDFNEFGLGYFLFDLVQVLWTHSMWPDYEVHMSRVLASYESIRMPDDSEGRHLHLFQTLPLIDCGPTAPATPPR